MSVLLHKLVCVCTSYCLYRSTRGKHSEQFLQSLRELLLTICSMMSMECKENELIAPRAQAQSLQFLPQTFDLFLSVMSVKSLGCVQYSGLCIVVWYEGGVCIYAGVCAVFRSMYCGVV